MSDGLLRPVHARRLRLLLNQLAASRVGDADRALPTLRAYDDCSPYGEARAAAPVEAPPIVAAAPVVTAEAPSIAPSIAPPVVAPSIAPPVVAPSIAPPVVAPSLHEPIGLDAPAAPTLPPTKPPAAPRTARVFFSALPWAGDPSAAPQAGQVRAPSAAASARDVTTAARFFQALPWNNGAAIAVDAPPDAANFFAFATRNALRTSGASEHAPSPSLVAPSAGLAPQRSAAQFFTSLPWTGGAP